MSTTDPYDPTTYPTPAAGMAAVVPPLTLEQRMGLIEQRIVSIETRLDSSDAKHDAVVSDVAALKTDVSAIKSEMGSQTTTLESHTTALADLKTASEKRTLTLDRIENYLKPLATQRVKDALTGLFLAAILALTAYLTSKGHAP